METPLHKASGGGHCGIVKLLLDFGASAELTDHYECSALNAAMEKDQGAVAQLLLSRGALVDSGECGWVGGCACSACGVLRPMEYMDSR